MENNYDENENIETEYGIDLFEIYDYEVNLFHKKKITHEELRLVYYFIEEFFLQKKPKHFIEVSYEPNAPRRLYTDKYLSEVNQFIKGVGITFCFLNQDKLYDIEGKQICVFKHDVNSLDFEKLFAYSLKTYEVKLSEIYPFLHFHLANNFENNSRNFHHFLEIVLTQHDILLNQKIVKFVRIWMQENSILIPQNSEIQTTNIPIKNYSSFKETDDEFNEASLEEIPENYTIVDLKINRTNTMKYFSFLYTTIDKNGEHIMSKQDFIEVFKYGIAIPSQPAQKLLELNLKVLNIGSINYAISQFYLTYSRTVSQKKDIMRFMGYYFEIFNKKISTPKAFESWNKNLTSNKKPLNFRIMLPDIIPTKI